MTYSYVDTDSGNDANGGTGTGDAWLTLIHAMDADLDLVTATESHTIRVYGSVDQDMNTGSRYLLDGWAVNATYRLYIENYEAGWDGKWDEAVWHMINTNTAGMEIRDDYVTFNKIMVEKTAQSGNYQECIEVAVVAAANEIIFSNCLFKGAASANRERILTSIDSDAVLRLYNCAFFNGSTGSHSTASNYVLFTGTTLTIDNCVFNGGYIGVYVSAGTVTTYNSFYTNQGSAPTGGSFNAGSDYNSTDGATAVANNNTNDLESQTITYGNAGAGDFSLASGDGVDDGGASPIYDYGSVDIIGTARPQNSVWDRGAFELVAAGGGSIVVLRRRRQ